MAESEFVEQMEKRVQRREDPEYRARRENLLPIASADRPVRTVLPVDPPAERSALSRKQSHAGVHEVGLVQVRPAQVGQAKINRL